jgi:hypothetical protein
MSNILKSPLKESLSPVLGSPQRHRKSRRWVWITLGVLALLCVLGALVVNFSVSPAIAEEQYYIAIREQDYAKAYSYLGSEVQARLSQQAFIQQAQQQDEALGRMTRYTEDNIPIGYPATLTETVTRARMGAPTRCIWSYGKRKARGKSRPLTASNMVGGAPLVTTSGARRSQAEKEGHSQ